MTDIGTWSIESKDKEERVTSLLPKIEDKESFESQTLFLPEQMEYKEKREDILIIWSESLESMTCVIPNCAKKETNLVCYCCTQYYKKCSYSSLDNMTSKEGWST